MEDLDLGFKVGDRFKVIDIDCLDAVLGIKIGDIGTIVATENDGVPEVQYDKFREQKHFQCVESIEKITEGVEGTDEQSK